MAHRLVRYEYFFVADHRPNTFNDGFYDGLNHALVFGVRLVGDGVSVSVLCLDLLRRWWERLPFPLIIR